MSRFSWRYEHWIIVHDHADLPPISLHVSFTFQFLAPIYPLFYIAEQFSSLALLGSDFEPPNTIIIFCQTKNLLPQLRLLTEAHGCSSPLPQPSPPPHSVSETGREQCVYFITAELCSGPSAPALESRSSHRRFRFYIIIYSKRSCCWDKIFFLKHLEQCLAPHR